MKKFFHVLTSLVLTVGWMTPTSPAYAVSAGTLVKAGEELKVVFSNTTSPAGKALVAKLVNSEGKVVQTLVTEITPKSTLKNFLPSKVSQDLKLAQSKMAAGGFSVGKVFGEKLLKFPAESAGFFVALGAIMFFETVYNEAHNPVAYDQLITSQMDPVGQLAFYSFMVANGLTAEPMMQAIRNGRLSPKFGPFITFAGMGIGSVASNIVHELGHSPQLWKCARSLISSGTLDSSCDKAGENWIERGGVTGILNEWAPGFVSLIGSVIISGTIQSGLNSTGKIILQKGVERGIITTTLKITADWTAVQVLKVAGFEIGTLFVPGGIIVKGFRAAMFVGQLVMFTAVDEIIRNPVAFAYGNLWDVAPDLKKQEQVLISDLLRMKSSGWKQTQNKDLDSNIKDFTKLMTKWRNLNLVPILEAQSNWEMKLNQLTGMYRATKVFYKDFLSHMWQRDYGRYHEQYLKGAEVRIIDRIFPLNGIKVTGLDEESPDIFSEAPDMIEERQVATLNLVLQEYKKGNLKIDDKQVFNKTVSDPDLKQSDKDHLTRIIRFLNSPKTKDIGYGLEQLNCLVFFRSDNPPVKCERTVTGGAIREHALALRTALGDPRPIWTAGIGYVQIFEKSATNATLIKNANHPGHLDTVTTKTLGESLFGSMIFGPDVEAGASLIASRDGFPAIFRAPKIVADQNIRLLRIPPNSPLLVPTIFDATLEVTGAKKYQIPMFQYLGKGNIRSSVLSSDQNQFDLWWEKYAEAEYLKTWLQFEEKYQSNIAKLVEKLWRSQDSKLNRGPISNAVMDSLRQEMNFYLMTLGELLKDKMVLENGKVRAESLGTQSLVNLSNLNLDPEQPQLFSLLKQNSNLQFSLYMTMQKADVPGKLKHTDGRNFNWQNLILRDLEDLRKTIRKIQPLQVAKADGSTKTVTKTSVSNSELMQKAEALKEKLEAAKAVFLSNNADETATLNLNYSDYQIKVINACIEGLSATIGEFINIGMMANSVSYVERHDGNGFANPRCLPQQKGQSAPKAGGVQFVQQALGGCE